MSLQHFSIMNSPSTSTFDLQTPNAPKKVRSKSMKPTVLFIADDEENSMEPPQKDVKLTTEEEDK
jgi:hypothetical protein